MLPRDQYMKIAIQRMLIESPHQVNANNMIVNKYGLYSKIARINFPAEN